MNTLYAGSQPYTVELAKLLERQFGWKAVYFFTGPWNHDAVGQAFSGAVRHRYIDSVKGVPPEDVSLSSLLPLNLSDLDALRDCEPNALEMMERNDSNSNTFFHRERREFYYFLIRYWKTAIRHFRIENVVFEEEPHQVSDYVLYCLCGVLNLPTVLTVRTISCLGVIPMRRFEMGSALLANRYELALEQLTPGDSINLPPGIEDYFRKLQGRYDAVRAEHLWDQEEKLARQASSRGFLVLLWPLWRGLRARLRWEYIRAIWGFIFGDTYESDQKEAGKPIQESRQSYLKALAYKQITTFRKHRNRRYYESIASHSIIFERSYVLCALQYQPEKSTCPLGGRFVDQHLMIEMLARHLPESWTLVVKEHPSQFVTDYTRYGEQFRNRRFYDRIRRLPNVELVSVDADPFLLIDRARAVASVGGTLCWEAVVRGVPALNFAHAWFRGCEGVFQITDAPDVVRAYNAIERGFQVDRDKVRLFARVLGELGFDAAIGGEAQLKRKGLSATSNAEIHFAAIAAMLAHESSSGAPEDADARSVEHGAGVSR